MEKNPRLLIVSLAKLDAIVIQTIERETGKKCLELYKYPIPTRVSGIKRHVDCIVLAFRALTLKNRHQTIIFWQQFIGLYFNLWCYVLVIRKFPQSIVLTVIYIRRYGFIGKIFYHFFKLAFKSKYIDKLVCHSSNERSYYLNEFGQNLKDKVIFCKLGEGLVFSDCVAISEEKYFFSGGSSNRDYGTLIKAFDGLHQKLIIACKPENISTKDIPSNITILNNAYGMAFSDLIKNAYAVILTILDPNVSSGQLVLLNAMRFGKCSIVTDGNCMVDYTNKEYTISVPAKSVSDLREAVNFLTINEEEHRKMSVNANNNYNNQYSIDKYAERIAGLVN